VETTESGRAAFDLTDRVRPLRRVGVTSDIGYCVLYLASDASSFVTGQLLSPNGGLAMHC
jgi:3-oxoacyl-[acyl-carrier protein] reductase